MSAVFCLLRSNLVLKLLDAVGADVLALVIDDVFGAVTENAGRVILMKNNVITINKNLESILFSNIQGAAKFDGQNDTSELINFSDNSGRLQTTNLQSVSNQRSYPTNIRANYIKSKRSVKVFRLENKN